MPDSSSATQIVITDTSCFILLDKINAVEVLQRLFTIAFTTPEIAAEFGKALPYWVRIQNCDQSLKKNFQNNLDEGEASALALALAIGCDYIILDDKAARKLAKKLNLTVIGTVGILLLAKQNGVISQLRPYLDLVQQTNFRLSPHLIEKLLHQAGE